MVVDCPGRDVFAELIPFGSEKNQCILGLETPCTKCKYYKL